VTVWAPAKAAFAVIGIKKIEKEILPVTARAA
jgi:hypothetical protein